MLEPFLFGAKRQGIVVQTHKGSPIQNYIAPPPSQYHVNCYYGVLRPTHGKQWEPRKDAVGVYNCAGMVWANRRTCLTEPEEWELILNEDGYRKLDNEDDADIGDVAVYRNRVDGEIMHVARVCRKQRLHTPGGEPSKPILRALSKWDQSCGEDIHALPDVHIDGGTPFHIEIWTDRPAKPTPQIAQVPELLLPL
ncbi:MAG: hypothetical protein WD894_12885 [Pirellulales bacterium]